MKEESMKVIGAALVLLCATLSACKTREVVKPEPPPPTESQPAEPLPSAAVDAALRTAFKSYVGLSIDQEGAVRLALADAGEFDAATGIAREVWAKTNRQNVGERLPRFTFIQAAAGPADLHDAFSKMRDVLTLPNVVFLDLDEACGCITVGIAEASVATQVLSFATAHGVSQALVRTVVTPHVVRLQSLRDEYRPTMGGVQIQNKSAESCTLGLPTYSLDHSKYGFLTASHCTEGPQGEMQGSWISQRGGRWFWGDRIGVETIDLPLFDTSTNASCPMGRRCRLSDVAFAEYDQVTLGIIGRIARPHFSCTAAGTACTLNVDRLTDDIRMTQGISNLMTGVSVNKVGRTSGWTRGAITNTCVDVNIVGTDAMGRIVDTMMTMLCQDQVGATSLAGDSGSPVFTFDQTTGTGNFAGILWGGSSDPARATFLLYTPITGINQELGHFIYNQRGVAAPFDFNGTFYTSDVADELDLVVERNVVPSNEVQFVLNAGTGIDQRKQIVLVEGVSAGSGRWTIEVINNINTAGEGLYTYQLPGGRIEFYKQKGGAVVEVSRVPIDRIPGGTRLTFTWRED